MLNRLLYIVITALFFSSCYSVRNYQKNKPFVFKNTIEINGGNFNKDERSSLKQRMYSQLDDSMKVIVKDVFFIRHVIKDPPPPAYDSAYAGISAGNMKNTLLHLGYYGAKASFEADTIVVGDQRRVTVHYKVDAGNPTLIDTFSYRLKYPELQQLATSTKKETVLEKGTPITRDAVLTEITRLVELYRNNGYYKFSSEDIRMRGDTTIAALTSISDDPFETIRLLAEANEKRNKPSIKLALVLNPLADSQRIRKYYINNIVIYPDYSSNDLINQRPFKETTDSNLLIRYHRNIIKNKFLSKNIFFKKGDLYKQDDYTKTIYNFSRTGVWQNVDIQVQEAKDSSNLLDMTIRLVPARKYGFEANIEASYSANSNSNSAVIANYGNLLGFSGNVSLQNRNLAKQAIKMTHALRAGVELNLNANPGSDQFINSNELSYTNTVSMPKLLFPFKWVDEKKLASDQTFFSANVSNTNRIGLFKLFSAGFGMGYEFNFNNNKVLTVKPINLEYSNLYGRTETFDNTIKENPYLRYSFNTALVLGSSIGYSVSNINPKHINRVNTIKVNLEESGFLLYFAFPLEKLNLFDNTLKKFIKLDFEDTYTITKKKSATSFRGFVGIGVPLGKSDTTLPFFKQYYGGGPNSMRGWPIRGIGPGSKSLPTVGSFADRTGDIRLEANAEYRHDLLTIIPNSLTLKWALFTDIGNIWNFKNTNPNGALDSTQFKFKNLYKQLGVTAGTGLRFDFNYVLLRFDLGFRFKRPDIEKNAGWKAPSIGFDDLFKKLFSRGPNNEYRQWRYENFNFSIGLSYPF